MPVFRLPARIRVAQITRPVPWLRIDDDGLELESVVDPPGPYQGLVFQPWPQQEVDVTGYDWTAWTWFGWTIVLMWEPDD